jgi:hypothetical protein
MRCFRCVSSTTIRPAAFSRCSRLASARSICSSMWKRRSSRIESLSIAAPGVSVAAGAFGPATTPRRASSSIRKSSTFSIASLRAWLYLSIARFTCAIRIGHVGRAGDVFLVPEEEVELVEIADLAGEALSCVRGLDFVPMGDEPLEQGVDRRWWSIGVAWTWASEASPWRVKTDELSGGLAQHEA